MKKLILFMALLTSIATFALPNGNWSGQLDWYVPGHSEPKVLDCVIGIMWTTKFLYIDDSDSCTYTDDYITRYDIVGNQLYYYNELVGEFSENEIHFSQGGYWFLDLILNPDNSLSVLEKSIANDGSSDSMVGTLNPYLKK